MQQANLGNGSVEFLDLLRISLGLVVTSILALAFFLSVKREFTGRMILTRSWVSAGCLDLRTDHVFPQQRGPAKLSLANLSRWCHGGLLEHLILRSTKVRGAWHHLQGILDGWQGGINLCSVCDDVRVLLVLWDVEVHMDTELVCS